MHLITITVLLTETAPDKYLSPYNFDHYNRKVNVVQQKQCNNSFNDSHSISPVVCVQRVTLLPTVSLQLPLHHHYIVIWPF